jgi:hypothetical protein
MCQVVAWHKCGACSLSVLTGPVNRYLKLHLEGGLFPLSSVILDS